MMIIVMANLTNLSIIVAPSYPSRGESENSSLSLLGTFCDVVALME